MNTLVKLGCTAKQFEGVHSSMVQMRLYKMAKLSFALLVLCWTVGIITVNADVLDDLKTVNIDGRKYIGTQILCIANDIEERGNEALATAGKERFSIRMGGVMGGASYLFRDIYLPQTSIYDAICRMARAANCTVSANERTVVVAPRDEAEYAAARIDKIVLDGKHYTSEPSTNIVDDLWRRTNDILFETTRWGIDAYYPHIATNLSISIPATNALDAFRIVAKSIKADVSFDGYSLDMSISDENTEIARLLKDIHIDDFNISAGTRFYDGMESLRRQINLGHTGSEGESVKFEYCGAQTNLPMAAVRLTNTSAFEAVSNICNRTHRCFSCSATGRTVSIGLEMAEFTNRFRNLRFQGGRFSGDSVIDTFLALLSAINANLEQNDMLTVGASISGLQSMEKPLCIDIKPCTTWDALEHFARITNSKASWEHATVCFRSADDPLSDKSTSGKLNGKAQEPKSAVKFNGACLSPSQISILEHAKDTLHSK